MSTGDKPDNLRLLDGGKTANEAADAIRRMQTNLPHLIDHAVLTARLRRASYEAHKREGFTDEQALELCKTVF